MLIMNATVATPRQRIAQSFGRAVHTYDRCAELQRHVASRLLAMLPDADEIGAVLDAGCGTGFCTAALQARYPRAAVVALDLAEPMLQATRQRADASHVLCADIQQLPLQSEQFDVVTSSLTIQWCNALPALFDELQRVTRSGGRVLLSTFGPQTLRELRDAWASVDGYRHTSEFIAAETLLDAAQQAGFKASLDAEMRVQHYASLRALAAELKGLGAHNLHPQQHSGLTTPRAFKAASAAFVANAANAAAVPVSWEVFYLDLQKPRA